MSFGSFRCLDRIQLAGLWSLLLIFAGVLPGEAAQSLYRFSPPATWIKVATPAYDSPAPGNTVSAGSWILLLDRQIRIRADGDDQYGHLAARALNDTGVDNLSQIDLDVDPSCESLDIHFVRIVRDKVVIDAGRHARITALPQETELQDRIYNGRYNINVLLSDVRPGDIVEYAYTVHSRERLFPGHFAASLPTGWSSPIQWQIIRVLWPVTRTMHVRMSDGSMLPPFSTRGDVRELELNWRDLAAIAVDDQTPGWYSSLPHLDLSDLTSWSDVARMVNPLYSGVLQNAGRRVAEVAEEIRKGGGSEPELALRALQYAQEQIRYTSISIGAGTHRPADPDTTLERRFGDCKDKSVLLVALLDRLGIRARPALVNTQRGRVLPEALPTPHAFNHMIVRLEAGNKVYWVDATADKQCRPLSSSDSPNFAHALVVGGPDTGLVVIPAPLSNSRRREVTVELDLRDGTDKPARLDVTTRFIGELAEEMRSSFKSMSLEQHQSNYLNYEAQYYPTARSAGTLGMEDDMSDEGIVVREHYILDPAFASNEGGGSELLLHPDELYRYADALSSSVRHSPLALEYPILVRQQIVVHLPGAWPVTPEVTRIDNPAFRFQANVEYSSRTLTLNYEYEALADHVETASLKQYVADRKRFHDSLGYRLSYNPNAATAPRRLAIAPLPLFALLLSLALSVWGAVRWAYRFDPPPRIAEPDWPAGLGGWLTLPTIDVVVAPFMFALVIAAWAPFINADMWYMLPKIANSRYQSWAHPILMTLVALAGPMLVGSILRAVVYLRRRTSAPAIQICFYWLALVNTAVLLTFTVVYRTEAVPKEIRSFIYVTTAAVVWTAYMLNSRRVKATFRNRFASNKAMEPLPDPPAPDPDQEAVLLNQD